MVVEAGLVKLRGSCRCFADGALPARVRRRGGGPFLPSHGSCTLGYLICREASIRFALTDATRVGVTSSMYDRARDHAVVEDASVPFLCQWLDSEVCPLCRNLPAANLPDKSLIAPWLSSTALTALISACWLAVKASNPSTLLASMRAFANLICESRSLRSSSC